MPNRIIIQAFIRSKHVEHVLYSNYKNRIYYIKDLFSCKDTLSTYRHLMLIFFNIAVYHPMNSSNYNNYNGALLYAQFLETIIY